MAALLVNDLRNPDGLTRPLLRGAAGKLTESRFEALHKAGAAYLRLDPPAADVIEPPPALEAPAQGPYPSSGPAQPAAGHIRGLDAAAAEPSGS